MKVKYCLLLKRQENEKARSYSNTKASGEANWSREFCKSGVDKPQNYNRYGYCWNNPLKYTDESGEWIWIVVAAVVGGVINWGIHGFRMDMEGLKAFGIGAAAGTIGALTGGAGFAAAGGGAGGVGGFFAGAFGGLVGSATSSSFLSMGNHVAFGDPLMSGKDFVKGLVFGAVTGGVFNGIAALANSRNFWNGSLPRVAVQPITLPSPAGIDNSNLPKPGSDAKLPNTVEPSVAPTNQAQTANKITITKNVDGSGYSVKGLELDGGVSKNVKEALNTLDEIKQAGGTVKINPMNPNQELNMTIQGGGQKLDFRIETHKLPIKFGGDGINPIRHMNVDIKGINLLNKGHVILN
jgi:hypothetical protein